MKRVDAREFPANAANYLAAGEPLDIEEDGRVIGRYRPAPAGERAAQPPNGHAQNGAATETWRRKVDPKKHEDMEWISRRLQEIYAETGMTEDEFAAYFDMTKPFPLDAPAARESH